MYSQDSNKVARDLMTADSEDVHSQLTVSLLRRALLEIIVTKSYNEQNVTKNDVLTFVRHSSP